MSLKIANGMFWSEFYCNDGTNYWPTTVVKGNGKSRGEVMWSKCKKINNSLFFSSANILKKVFKTINLKRVGLDSIPTVQSATSTITELLQLGLWLLQITEIVGQHFYVKMYKYTIQKINRPTCLCTLCAQWTTWLMTLIPPQKQHTVVNHNLAEHVVHPVS